MRGSEVVLGDRKKLVFDHNNTVPVALWGLLAGEDEGRSMNSPDWSDLTFWVEDGQIDWSSPRESVFRQFQTVSWLGRTGCYKPFYSKKNER